MSELIDNRQHRIRTMKEIFKHLLFSCVERGGITGPSTMMWGKDDEVRGLLKELGTALGESTATSVVEILEERS